MKEIAVHSGDNLVIQSHMNQLEKAKELRRNATDKNLPDRKEVHEDNINRLVIRHT